MRYTLRQLEVFLATVHFENVTKAADSLAMSQSAASAALKDLERQFDFQLFDRIGKRLQLNSVGRNLRAKAEALLEQAQNFEMEMINPASMGHLNLGATLTIGNYLAVDLVAEFMRRSPGANARMVVANTESIARQVLNFDLDIGLVEGELVHSELEVSHWRDDELVVFCSPGHPYASKSSLNDEDLLVAEWILRETGSGTRQGFDRAMHGLLSGQHVKLELQHTEAIKRAVESGLGISCLSRISLEQAFERGDLVPLAVPHRDLRRAFYFILHKDKFRGPAIRQWLELCREGKSS